MMTRVACAFVALWVGGQARAASTDLVVVASSSSTLSKVSVDDLRALYSGKQKSIQGAKAHAFLLDQGTYDDAIVRMVLGMDRHQYDEYWTRAASSGVAATPPDALRSGG